MRVPFTLALVKESLIHRLRYYDDSTAVASQYTATLVFNTVLALQDWWIQHLRSQVCG